MALSERVKATHKARVQAWKAAAAAARAPLVLAACHVAAG